MYRDLPPHLVEMIGTTRKDKLTFIAGALTMRSMPPEGLPEVCFCGRSNVGKSSIINAVTLSTTVRSSDKPGMTQQVENFPLLPPPYGAWPPNTCFCHVCPPALSSITLAVTYSTGSKENYLALGMHRDCTLFLTALCCDVATVQLLPASQAPDARRPPRLRFRVCKRTQDGGLEGTDGQLQQGAQGFETSICHPRREARHQAE